MMETLVGAALAYKLGIPVQDPWIVRSVARWLKAPMGLQAISSMFEFLDFDDTRWNKRYLEVAIEARRIDMIEDNLETQHAMKSTRLTNQELRDFTGISRWPVEDIMRELRKSTEMP